MDGKNALVKVTFPDYVGAEIEGKRTTFELLEIITTTLFDPKGKENEKSYRFGRWDCKKRITLFSVNQDEFPLYVADISSDYFL